MSRILVALSGGVDSAAAASLLVEQGYEVVAAYMKNWVNEENIPGDCPWEQDIVDARAVCEVLGIELRVVDLVEHYKARVVDYLIEGYRNGSTPNPDVLCNREMKFGVLLDYALSQGFEGVATGHYARRFDGPKGSYILRGIDNNKDQSYFLALMRPEQVASAIFPVGDLCKPAVRDVARRFHLPNAEKKDSQGICFIGQVKMSDFLRHYLPDNPGNIVDLSGRVLGRHDGLHFFTMGQRKGHHVASPREGIAYVVVGKDLKKNELIVGYEGEETQGLYSTRALVGQISNTLEPLPERLLVQARYRSPAVSATCRYLTNDSVELLFDTPIRALALGQVCAFYAQGSPAEGLPESSLLLGGGFFYEIS